MGCPRPSRQSLAGLENSEHGIRSPIDILVDTRFEKLEDFRERVLNTAHWTLEPTEGLSLDPSGGMVASVLPRPRGPPRETPIERGSGLQVVLDNPVPSARRMRGSRLSRAERRRDERRPRRLVRARRAHFGATFRTSLAPEFGRCRETARPSSWSLPGMPPGAAQSTIPEMLPRPARPAPDEGACAGAGRTGASLAAAGGGGPRLTRGRARRNAPARPTRRGGRARPTRPGRGAP